MQRLELAKGESEHKGESGHKGEQPATVAEDGEEKRRGSERRPLGHGIRSYPRFYEA